MAEQEFQMTAEGKAKLEAELEDLKVNKRPEIVERIKIARGFGDLSENSEYESAKDEQSLLEGQIASIENQLHYAVVVDSNAIADDEVAVGKTVSFVEVGDDEEESYTIVGAAESDPFAGKISNDSPIAKALIGKHTGDQVTISTPGGDMQVKITKVTK
ncbi:transcription elongation factor GreA [Loigolactobacillus coryniformis]|jgi:transcription elongation factor GreA|uniref:Transcription elongation factor GreA n=4 Tax=Loigolactobacillus coryniformis TaxID=1610 RepID=J2ZQD4_9LACO|nr:transcription elongation factor GreA [Loigolactobacillus coryniformis]MDT3390904.1 transcription elongation factor GreA [Bacillota bacterium]OEH89383.1 transcription elongation factor GreA [Loigolactobacillus coryniformis subsp. coryniformis]RRG06841.1 MAG: transcription elongation factor GreA [Lactobacillus sp.]ATO44024.1 transcription elongation factor GreA [Loigolactobacillus coryniformis subsp. torquens DSM 20004 = KCTC 3535]ATO55701.1 transcription elongation factor GreA [Loigolactobac